jgi:uncharacterized protein (DUF983 family)
MSEDKSNPAPASGTSGAFLARLGAVIRLRCPRCLKGKVFRGMFAMNDPCPVCGLIFQREEGYFLGAMYVGYLLACAFFLSGYFVGSWLFPEVNAFLLVLGITLLYLPLAPAVFRYSRVIWMTFERWSCPGDVSATSYEKARQKEFARRAHEGQGEGKQ